ncbi:ribonuclease H-like domain-containing protein, partial [Tanacetum coccineum]
LESVEAQLIVHQKNEVAYEEKIAVLEFEVKDKCNAVIRLTNQLDQTLREKEELKAKLKQFETSSKILNKLINSQLSAKDKTGLGYGDQLSESDSEVITSVFNSRSSDGDDNQTNDRFKKDNGYHAVPPPLTRNYMPPLADLSFEGLDDSVYRPTANKTSASTSKGETSVTQTSNISVEMPKVDSVRNNGVIIEDWVSDDEDIFQDSQTTVKSSFKKIEFTKARNKSVKSNKQADKPRMVRQNPKEDRRDRNDCDFHEKRMSKKSVLTDKGKGGGYREVRPIWNNTQKLNHQNKFVPTAVLTRSRRIPVNTVKQHVNTATHKHSVNVSKSNLNTFPKPHSPIRRPFYKSTVLNTRISKGKVNTGRVNGVNTAGQTAVSIVEGSRVTAVKASAGCGNPQQALKYKGMFDSGCSRHMTGNKTLLSDYQDIDGGFVSFGGNTRGGKITGIGKIRTDKIDFADVFFMKELKFNLFSVSQICEKKNNVLFTETECLVLSPDFKLLDESQVLLRVPRQNNMYSFDLKNVVPSGDLTCLFAKATIDESKLWHRRLGHVNFKIMNKLVKGNLVRVAERKNRTLIKAARTMLADSLLPTVFWAEAVNTACYVLNRVLVTKPFNKTPYELIIGRAPSISFMRPFGCPVTILNTLDPLGKFDGKDEEGFLVGYSVNSKTFRVFNNETRKVEDNLHVNFLENKPNVAGQGPNWIFDIDSLTNSMNYQPVTVGNQTNKKQKDGDDTADDASVKQNVQEPTSEDEQALRDALNKMIDQEKEATEHSDAVRKEFEAQCNRHLLQG